VHQHSLRVIIALRHLSRRSKWRNSHKCLGVMQTMGRCHSGTCCAAAFRPSLCRLGVKSPHNPAVQTVILPPQCSKTRHKFKVLRYCHASPPQPGLRPQPPRAAMTSAPRRTTHEKTKTRPEARVRRPPTNSFATCASRDTHSRRSPAMCASTSRTNPTGALPAPN
jgi:hypothetical protein